MRAVATDARLAVVIFLGSIDQIFWIVRRWLVANVFASAVKYLLAIDERWVVVEVQRAKQIFEIER